MAGPAAQPAGRVRLAVRRPPRRSRRGAGCWRTRARGVEPSEVGRFGAARDGGATTGRRTPAAARSRSRRGSSASGSRCAPTRPSGACDHRRRADLRRGRRLRPPRAPGALPPARRGGRGSPARRPQRPRPAVGQPALRLGGDGADGYRWWIERMRRVLELVDVFRIDHFRGFAGYWTVPAGAETARDGWWSPGPGLALFRAAEEALGPLPVIAGGPRRHHAGRPRAPRRARLPGHGRAAVVAARARRQPAPPREPPREPGRLHLDPRHRHARRASPARRTCGRWSSGRSRRGARSRSCPPRTSSARQRGAHEPARARSAATGVAPRARPADAGACCALRPPRRRADALSVDAVARGPVRAKAARGGGRRDVPRRRRGSSRGFGSAESCLAS